MKPSLAAKKKTPVISQKPEHSIIKPEEVIPLNEEELKEF